MISSLCSAASQKKYVSALWQFLCYLDQPVNSFPQARHLQIPSTVTMSSFPDPSFFSVFTDPSQVFFLKMCHPEMSLVFHMKLACRAWHFSVGFPSCSGERTSMATMTYKDASWDGLCRLPYLSNLSFPVTCWLCFENCGLLLFSDSWAHSYLRTFAVLLPTTHYSPRCLPGALLTFVSL